MGCDPDWLECECTKGQRTFYHSDTCKVTIEYKQEEAKVCIKCKELK